MARVQNLIVLDIDNTVFDWVTYYVSAMEALLYQVAEIIKVDFETLASEAKTIFEGEGSIEYPFLIQELPSVMNYYGSNIEAMLKDAVQPGRQAFNQVAQNFLHPYPDVMTTLKSLKRCRPDRPIVALTDAPRYVAMWKLNKLGLLSCFDAVYGLPDPKIPVDRKTNQVKVDQEILLKHLEHQNFNYSGRIRTLPPDYEKPGTKGLKTVLMDYEMESHFHHVLWVGDNLRKDVALGKQLGVQTGWARYGTQIPDEMKMRLLAFSPTRNVHKNVALDPNAPDSPCPDFIFDHFSEIWKGLPEDRDLLNINSNKN